MITFTNISLQLSGVTIFDKFNFQIDSGEKVVIFGKSGTGKSTLLRLLMGFEVPEDGSISFFGKELTAENIFQIRRQIAYVDQDVMLGEGKVRDVFQGYLRLQANQDVKFPEEKLQQELSEFDLSLSLLDKDVSHLSGGERQRMALVLAMLLHRPVMVLDEVTSALDTASKKLVINRLLREKQTTLLVVTHDLEWKKQKGVKVFDFKEKAWK